MTASLKVFIPHYLMPNNENKSKVVKIKFVDVSSEYVKRKNHNIVLRLVNFKAYEGEVTAILGSSGCGKTTLIKTMLGFQDYGGMIYLNGTDIEKIPLKDRHFSYVSQKKVLIPSLTIFDNLAFPLKTMGLKADEIKERIIEVAKLFDIEILLSRKPRHLSGGQIQKVAFAKSMISYPDTYLLDEPFSELSPDFKKEMFNIIKDIKDKYHSTFIYVSHNPSDVLNIADRIVIMNEGSVIQEGETRKVLEHPINNDVKAILGISNEKPL